MAPGVTLEPLPFREAIAALEARGVELRPTFSYLDMWQAEHASAFTVAKAMDLDVLSDIHQAVTRSIADGETLETFQRKLKPELVRRGWWGRREMTDPLTGELTEVQLGSPHRLRTIFDANMRTSHATGRWQRFQRTKATRPYLRYVAVLDDRTRPQHRAWHGIVLPVDHPWWETHAPPNGWYCRCILVSLSERDLQRYGWQVTEPPTIETRRWRNPRTGEEVFVPVGIDPGWAYNAGAAGMRAGGRVALTAEAAAGKLVTAPPALAAQTWRATPQLRETLRRDWVEIAEAALSADGARRSAVANRRRVVGVIRPEILEALARHVPVPDSPLLTASGANLSHALRDTKVRRGTAVPPELLARLPEAIESPQAVVLAAAEGGPHQLIYVMPGPEDDPRLAKLVFRGAITVTGRWADGVLRARLGWRLATAGLVQPNNLSGPDLALLWGSL